MLSLKRIPKNIFFTGKGGVGKTSLSCAFSIFLADSKKKVLVVSTDPASNLEEVLQVKLTSGPSKVPGVKGLWAVNIDPEVVSRNYRERVTGPFRGILPAAAIKSIEEQLSGACTTEIASFEEFARLLGDEETAGKYDHIVFDTAPTGHTLRLLKLPAAWDGFLANNTSGNSCLGPLAGLQAHRELFAASLSALTDRSLTAIILVARPDNSSLKEAARTHVELAATGIANQHLVVNGTFPVFKGNDKVAGAMGAKARNAIDEMPAELKLLKRDEFLLSWFPLNGVENLRAFICGRDPVSEGPDERAGGKIPSFELLDSLIDRLAESSGGVIMTMGKGGVGKTTIARKIARGLAGRGLRVHLTTTDPAATNDSLAMSEFPGLRVSRLDPELETRKHRGEVLRETGPNLDEKGLELLEEDLRSPCTEEIAVFKAFSRIIDEGREGFVILDTAPTGHTLLLLDASEAFHKEVTRTGQQMPDAVRFLRDRLRDPEYTKIFIVTIPEATPVHEAAYLQADLQRAGIFPYSWIINQSLSPLALSDPFLKAKKAREAVYLREVSETHAKRVILVPWTSEESK